MAKDTKILIASILFTFLAIIGLSFVLSKDSSRQNLQLQEVLGLQIEPATYDLGEVPIDGGIITKEYKIKNTLGSSLKLKKIATSCMCTQAKIVVGENETRYYGMEHPMDKNPPVNIEIQEGKTATVVVDFDPAAHGPQGTGPFEREVELTFTDPAGIKRLTFSGTVVSN